MSLIEHLLDRPTLFAPLRKRYASVRSVACLILLLVPVGAFAWCASGHRLVAEMAYERLSPATRDKVQALLALEPGATFESISTWADEVRSPSTAPWHYVTFNRAAPCHYVPDAICPNGSCVVGAIERQLNALSTSPTPTEQLKALKWVVHLVADVDQPLHAGLEGDKAGNLYQVRAFGRGTNLHSVWDGGLIQTWPGGLSELRSAASRSIPKGGISLSPRDWAEESCRIASSEGFYPPGRVLESEYQHQWSAVVARRLAEAAERLARTLTVALP